MKIAVLAARLPPANDGVGDHADMLARTLVGAGHRVVMIGAGPAAESLFYTIHIVGKQWDVSATARAVKALRVHRVDTVIVEYTPFFFGVRSLAPIILLAAARAMRLRSGIIVHEAFYPPDHPAVRRAFKARVLATRDAATIRCANVIAVPGAARAQKVTSRLPSVRDRIVIVPIGSNIEPPVDYLRSPASPVTVVAFGVVMPRRRLEYGIAALARLLAAGRDVRLDIIGRVEDAAYAAELADLATRRGLADRIRFRGQLLPAQISEALSTATAGIHLALEGSVASSGSLLALLAHGVPTVALQTPGDDDVFKSAIRYGRNEESVAAAIDDLITEPPAALLLADAARACYQRNFAWTTAAGRLQSALEKRH